jgi:HD-GYP domain-containing protein (c-di-GMP phosphodiesterase class II)
MRAQLRTVAVYSALAAAFQVAARLLPAPSAGAGGSLAGETMLATAATAAILALAAGYVAWDAREWSPAMLALGSGSAAVGLVVRFVTDDGGLAAEPSPGASFAPVLGVLAGSAWSFLSVQTWWPATGLRDLRQTVAVRTLLVVGLTGMALAAYLFAAFPELVPPDGIVRALSGLAATAYVASAARLARVWRLLRLPSFYGLTAGALAFALLAIAYGAGGVPGLPSRQADVLALVLVAVAVVSLGVEFRARAGLRAVTFGLILAGSLRASADGRWRTLGDLADRVAGHGRAMRGHACRVADLSARLAVHLRLDPSQTHALLVAAELHDIGKLLVPRALLQRSGRMNDAQHALALAHAVAGASIVSRVPDLACAAAAIAGHHERWDGAGVPRARRGGEISLAARVLAVADEYDALRSARSYKPAWGLGEAVSAIERESGRRFDPRVVEALVRLVANDTAQPATGEQPPDRSPGRRAA